MSNNTVWARQALQIAGAQDVYCEVRRIIVLKRDDIYIINTQLMQRISNFLFFQRECDQYDGGSGEVLYCVFDFGRTEQIQPTFTFLPTKAGSESTKKEAVLPFPRNRRIAPSPVIRAPQIVTSRTLIEVRIRWFLLIGYPSIR